jgi:hypothetical protein
MADLIPSHGSDGTSGGKVPNNAIKCSTSAGLRGFSLVADLASMRKSNSRVTNSVLVQFKEGCTHSPHSVLLKHQSPSAMTRSVKGKNSPGVAVM